MKNLWLSYEAMNWDFNLVDDVSLDGEFGLYSFEYLSVTLVVDFL